MRERSESEHTGLKKIIFFFSPISFNWNQFLCVALYVCNYNLTVNHLTLSVDRPLSLSPFLVLCFPVFWALTLFPSMLQMVCWCCCCCCYIAVCRYYYIDNILYSVIFYCWRKICFWVDVNTLYERTTYIKLELRETQSVDNETQKTTFSSFLVKLFCYTIKIYELLGIIFFPLLHTYELEYLCFTLIRFFASTWLCSFAWCRGHHRIRNHST